MNTAKEYQLEINLKDIAWSDVFSESYKIALRDTFVNPTSPSPKGHSFKNHAHSFVTQLKQNSKPLARLTLRKWQVVVVSYGMNTGSEINGDRPSVVFKADHSTKGEDIIVIPLTSALQQKQTDKYDVFVPKDKENNLFQNSFARLRQLRAVSLIKIGKTVGVISDPKVMHSITAWAQVMLWLNEQENPSQ